MNKFNILKSIGIAAVAIAVLGGSLAFVTLHPALAHDPDLDVPPVMAGDLHPDTPVHPVPEQVAPVQGPLTIEHSLENDMRGIFQAAGYDSMFVDCEHSSGSITAESDAFLLGSAYSIYHGMTNPPSVWMDDVSIAVTTTAEVAVCAGSAAKHKVSGVSFK